MRLATPQQVLSAVGIVTNEGSLANAGAVLDATSRIVEEMLETRLEEGTYTDFFDYHTSVFRGSFVPQTFRLSNGFLDMDSTVTVRESDEPMRLVTDGTPLLATDYVVDHVNGLVTIFRDVYAGYYTLSVTYTSGFMASGEERLLKGIPDWMTRAAIFAAQNAINLNPAHIASKKVTAVRDITKALRSSLAHLVNPHRRPRLDMNQAVRSVRHD